MKAQTKTVSRALALVFAFCALAFFTSLADAQGEPPPEAPAAPLLLPPAPAAGGAPTETPPAEPDAPTPLAVQELQLYMGGDPWWKVGTQMYATIMNWGTCPPGTTLNVSCWASPTNQPITLALEMIDTGLVPSNRTLYLDAETYGSNDHILINGTTHPNRRLLNSIVGVTDAFNQPLTTLLGRIEVQNLAGGFTLKGMVVDTAVSTATAVSLHDIPGALLLENVWIQDTNTTQYGLRIEMNNNIDLRSIRVNGNPANGANISNPMDSDRTIKILNSAFNENTGEGLVIFRLASVNLDGVSASKNGKGGLTAYSADYVTIKNSTFSGNGTISPFYGTGAHIYKTGSMKVFDSHFDMNPQTGLEVSNVGSVSIDNATFYNNSLYAFDIDTCDELLGVCESTGSGKVTLIGIDAWNNTNGMRVIAKNVIALKNASFVKTRGYLDNHFGSGSITVLYTDFTEGVGGYGLEIKSKGSVTVKGVSVTETQSYGLVIYNHYGTGNVNVQGGTDVANVFDDNKYTGLYIFSHGSINLANVSASWNGDKLLGWKANGVLVYNDEAQTPKSITIINSTFIENNGSGAFIRTRGIVSFTRVTASRNHTSGPEINSAGDGAYLDNLGNSSIRISYSYFNENYGNGIFILSRGGAITLICTNASNNAAGAGAHLINEWPATDKSVVIKGSASSPAIFNENDRGIMIQTSGSVSLSYVNARENLNSGMPAVFIQNSNLKVTISSSAFFENYGTGLEIDSFGNIQLTNVISNGSKNGHGLDLYLSDINASGAIAISKSQFNHNYYSGVFLETSGRVTVTRTTASWNMAEGLLINNGANNASSEMILNVIRTDHNGGRGTTLWSGNNVTVNSLIANMNGHYGLFIYASSGSGTVTLNEIETHWNGYDGIKVTAANNISINKTYTFMNGYFQANNVTINGATLDAVGRKVTIKNSYFIGNHSHGIYIRTFPGGSLLFVNTQASGNFYHNVTDMDVYWE